MSTTLDAVLPARPAAEAYRQLTAWWDKNASDYSSTTHAAWRARLSHYYQWCEEEGHVWLPATSRTIHAYLRCYRFSLSPATLVMSLSIIRSFHSRAGYWQVAHELGIRRAQQELSDAIGVVRHDSLDAARLGHITNNLDDSLISLWTAAAIWFVFDTRYRTGALLDVDAESVRFERSGTAWVPPPDVHDDWTRHGGYLSKTTTRHVTRWLKASQITSGALFPRVTPSGGMRSQGLRCCHLARTLRQGLDRTGVSVSTINFSSIRSAAISEMRRHNLGIFGVMKAIGYESLPMPRHYTRHIPDQSALELAALQNR